MTYLINNGIEKQIAFKIMEAVRRGKGLTPEWESNMIAHKIPEFYINSCKKIKYLFPRGHATAYVMMAVRVAYFKLYYPLQFYAVFFSIRSDAYDIESMIKGEEAIIAKIDALRARSDDRVNPLSNKELDQLKTLKVALEMTERGYSFKKIDLYRSEAKMFVVDEEAKALIPPFIVLDGLGEAAGQSVVDARNELAGREFLSKEQLHRLTKLTDTNIKQLEALGSLEGLSDTNQLTLF
ncbi:MAG: hypothetical protein HUJ60_05605 [Bacilli bacterium]|nr:hypothetical protein [Bacilli bacterium]